MQGLALRRPVERKTDSITTLKLETNMAHPNQSQATAGTDDARRSALAPKGSCPSDGERPPLCGGAVELKPRSAARHLKIHAGSCPAERSEGDSLLAVSFGGGTNSTAMLCGFRERGIRPDLIAFADTGGELPETYEHVAFMQGRVREWWGLEIEIVRKLYQGGFEGLEGQCLRHKQLPSLAYGQKSCSMKYKGEPQDRLLKRKMREAGVTIATRAIGFDAGERHRTKDRGTVMLTKKLGFVTWHPLVEWRWTRRECVEAITRANIPQPGKSSCFFCPARRRGEILKLKQEHPELYERAIAIEANSESRSNKGVTGLNYGSKWSEMVAADERQIKLFDWLETNAQSPIPCGCYDG